MIEISTDKSRLDVNSIYQFLTTAYWAKGRSIENVQKTIDNSLCFGVYLENKQIGFARICTDYTVFAYLMDIYILPKHRRKGYSKQLMEAIIKDDNLKSCKVWMLKTRDTHGLYKAFEFTPLQFPEKLMERILY